ncbi:MAG TPA: nucleotidyltransferase domain-containing protein [Candidatus Nanoarchaeia archaeon]|nr:nucleotidyltransferase domain-containing protein [Candidatus Nanoarchaeia archaeon]
MIAHRTIIGYAMSFASFLIDSPLGEKINKIILFGSAARGDFTSESDVDIFVDCDQTLERELEKLLTLFTSSQTYKIWALKNVHHEISLKVGDLSTWSLRREVISSGVILYGKYSEQLATAKYYALIGIEGLSKKGTAEQMHIMRKLYGYTQKVGKKKYSTEGLLRTVGGMKLGRGVLALPMDHRQQVLSFLTKNKISYKIYEVWSDSFEVPFKHS